MIKEMVMMERSEGSKGEIAETDRICWADGGGETPRQQ